MADDLFAAESAATPTDTGSSASASAPATTAPQDGSAAPAAPTPSEAVSASTAPAETSAVAEAAKETAPAETPAPGSDAVQPEQSLLGKALADQKPEEPPKKTAEQTASDEKDKKPEEAKPEDKKDEVKAEEAKPEPVKFEPVKFEYKIPEKFALKDADREQVDGMLNAFAENPRDAKSQQALIDYHVKTLTETVEKVHDFNRNFWNETRKNWRQEIMADEQLGGAGFATTSAAVARMVDLFVPQKERHAFEAMLELTGVGDHPAFWRAWHNAARFYDESPQPPPNQTPPKDIGKPPGRRGMVYPSMEDKR